MPMVTARKIGKGEERVAVDVFSVDGVDDFLEFMLVVWLANLF
jgi:hypothetical protein